MGLLDDRRDDEVWASCSRRAVVDSLIGRSASLLIERRERSCCLLVDLCPAQSKSRVFSSRSLMLQRVESTLLLQLGLEPRHVLVAARAPARPAASRCRRRSTSTFSFSAIASIRKPARTSSLRALAQLVAHRCSSSPRRAIVDAAHRQLQPRALDHRVELALDQRRRDRERVALEQLLDQLALELARAPAARPPRAACSRVLSRSSSSVSASPVSLANSSSSAGTCFSRASLTVTLSSPSARPARAIVLVLVLGRQRRA